MNIFVIFLIAQFKIERRDSRTKSIHSSTKNIFKSPLQILVQCLNLKPLKLYNLLIAKFLFTQINLVINTRIIQVTKAGNGRSPNGVQNLKSHTQRSWLRARAVPALHWPARLPGA